MDKNLVISDDYPHAEELEKILIKLRSLLALKEKDKQLKRKDELENLIKDVSEKKEQLQGEVEFAKQLNHFLDADSKKQFITEQLPRFLGIRLMTIFTIDDTKKEFTLFVSNHEDLKPGLKIPFDKKSVMYDVLITRKPKCFRNFAKSKYIKSKRPKYISGTSCTVPLVSAEHIIGVMNVNDPVLSLDDYQSGNLKGRLARLSPHLAVSIHNTILFEKVRDLSIRDSMTDLYNFRHFHETLRIEVEHAKRYDEPLSCIMIDIDDFKLINDTYGHHVGDLVLKALARSISIAVRSSDIPVRYGGDEFVILLPQTDKKYAGRMAQRLMDLFSGKKIRIPDNGRSIKVTLSMGIAGLPDDTLDMEELIKLADASLYKAKREGKNKISIT
ncbi:MAG: GGDEF domain-containing protein [Spirochaetota bacterium]|nr:MAG: GGDEF domain-containing protein [Spirochaetota bacterium]